MKIIQIAVSTENGQDIVYALTDTGMVFWREVSKDRGWVQVRPIDETAIEFGDDDD